jgi:quercetin dioxygenase-like cupin family protein
MRDALSNPCRPADLVEPRARSVVSQVLFRNAGGTLTAFGFAEGEGLDEHTNPNDAIIHVLDGHCTVVIRDTEHRVEAGEMLHLPASVPHAIEGGVAFRMLLILLKSADDREPGGDGA